MKGQKCEHLIITLVKRINRAFVLEKENPSEACEELRNVILILSTFGDRHKKLFKPLKWFGVFMDKSEWLMLFPTVEMSEKALETARFFATEATNSFFKKRWRGICEGILDKDLTRCLKKELFCFKDIYEFFLECHGFYNKRFDQAIHLRICKEFESHSVMEKEEFARARFFTEGGPGCARSDLEDQEEDQVKKDSFSDKCKKSPKLTCDISDLEDWFYMTVRV
jgi:hypothetical protein